MCNCSRDFMYRIYIVVKFQIKIDVDITNTFKLIFQRKIIFIRVLRKKKSCIIIKLNYTLVSKF
uniref:Uncharacterized protein n=1 Tax=Manihot esculenta TaxID=3983 RepID=A0A2C9VA01_MANES